MRIVLALVAVMVLTLGALFWTGPVATTAQAAGAGTADIVAGERIYAESCASCHGANLEGQANWQSPDADGMLPAPPHDETGHTWHHADGLLFEYTKLGGAVLMQRMGIEMESGMPGFGDRLTDAQIHDVLAFIKSTWPDRIRDIQAERTRAEGQ
ncbi:c-type cytochrome [Pseudaestuariivita atlantica]|uniref:Cytochrome C n=1 Tax=Pseudaestuariivita atlantica TaxID=1317121 RepID=A0A0L1JUM2_9RHOB|nr:cytochrome c [Pseudaestuariivita atlantica]KNG95402.1 cytochrome C [Pseudaestuariivita atlantica]